MAMLRRSRLDPRRKKFALDMGRRLDSDAHFQAQRTIESAFVRFDSAARVLAPSPGDIRCVADAIAEIFINAHGFRRPKADLRQDLSTCFEESLHRRLGRLSSKTMSALRAERGAILEVAAQVVEERRRVGELEVKL